MKITLKLCRIVRILLLVIALIYLAVSSYFAYFHPAQTIVVELWSWAFDWGLKLVACSEMLTIIIGAATSKKPKKPEAIGKVVQLKSGGPLMTVDEEDERTGFWYCVWFDEAHQRTGYFDPATLSQRY
jgi:uncharacterized protein YodC (DUF2158 family)